ncbi:hypothetical protein [Chitinophaga polysaccharea]|uniref:hypothetical protein n=1 Tax=Chitinophaga polysaccharea TaxID=1293035 RepID=UPI0011589638|nr:hypothetical protein [Chitinophaga polysaccharea]
MQYLKYISAVIFLMFFSFTGGAQAKLEKRMKEALEQRYKDDKYYADLQRGIYNRENWKNSWVGVSLTDIYKNGALLQKLSPMEAGPGGGI